MIVFAQIFCVMAGLTAGHFFFGAALSARFSKFFTNELMDGRKTSVFQISANALLKRA